MNCPRNLLEAWLDEELDSADLAAVEHHVAECADCAATAEKLRAQKAAIKATAPYYRAPARLRDLIRADLRRSSAPPPEHWRALAIAASVLLALSIAWNLLWPPAHLVQSIIDDHMRSLVAAQLVDVPSSDQHTVKPWFAGKLDFSPDVRNLDAEGFPLAGGRVDYLGGRRVAALVYRRRQHVINLFTWPDQSRSAGSQFSRNGYHILHWNAHGMTYWAVSDAGLADLEKLRDLYGD
jgi:anti-sigma factor RsiW